ncbi:hypothetical protein A2U01_0078010, partial [Trifolium medium]|nr:hypothetical protein [Trifolium medium]
AFRTVGKKWPKVTVLLQEIVVREFVTVVGRIHSPSEFDSLGLCSLF